MATSGYKSISRIEQGPSGKGSNRRGRTAGWYVRVWWRGEEWAKYFGDVTHGGKDAALTKAVAWRDAKEQELGKPRTEMSVSVYLAGQAGAEELQLMRERADLFAQKAGALA